MPTADLGDRRTKSKVYRRGHQLAPPLSTRGLTKVARVSLVPSRQRRKRRPQYWGARFGGRDVRVYRSQESSQLPLQATLNLSLCQLSLSSTPGVGCFAVHRQSGTCVLRGRKKKVIPVHPAAMPVRRVSSSPQQNSSLYVRHHQHVRQYRTRFSRKPNTT